MVSIASLWLPILLAAIAVFIASSLSHMVFKLHQNDYSELPGEKEIRDAMRGAGVGPGNYMFPYCGDTAEMGSDEMRTKFREGPVGFVNVLPSGPPTMGKSLGIWFAYSVLVGVFVAYVSGRALAPGTEYLAVFRIAGATAFLAYGLPNLVESIWRGQRWGTTMRHVVDGLVYALLTAGVFGWLWPA